ncbi:HD domain-containing protein [Octadecabacter sp. R77987]|uniref:HD domain-containing protein n=1 Tax=Octadecabacter sp. R77987 TaxID=3093874 RepID=UPI003671459B
MTDRIARQLAFLTEADKLKSVLRATTLCHDARFENSGEHSWHIALYALVMAEHAVTPVNIDRVIKMLLIHDLVEIDAGDNPIHGNHDPVEMAAVEQAAADRLFGMLPDDQGRELRALWEEFEAAQTDDAVFAKSLDRVQPLIANLESGGRSWIDYDVTRDQVETRVGTKVQRGAPAIWAAIKTRIDTWFAENR